MNSLLRRSLALTLLTSCSVFAQDDAKKKDADGGGDTPEVALKKMSVAPGLQAEVWAAEPLLQNPVAFAFDEQGRAFVAETGRRRSSMLDIRANEPWRIENLALRSVEERIAFLKTKYPESGRSSGSAIKDFNGDGRKDWHDLEVETERIKLVVDSNGDGKADHATVFAEGFKSLATGIGAGVCPHGGSVFYTCVPDVWRLDGERDGAATQRTALLTGFGVHTPYSGHDMHGAKFGPDGRLYWTIADGGAHVTTKEGKLIDNPDSGAVFRCNPDGTGMELFATGLRNPQSLAFNDMGDLFTGDNNADGGDAARWTHVVEGADYGWRIGWQFLPKLGAWNSEGMWHMDVDRTNLALLPPVAHIGHGPAGIAYYPGTGLPEKYREHFFMADFPGGVRAFALKPKGASYELAGLEPKVAQDNSAQQMTGKALWSLYPSDVGFAPGGGLYVLDWVYGWEKTGKGRIFRLFDAAADADALTVETKRLLNEGMAKRGPEELAKLLGHVDQRVRLAAQFELVKRKREDVLSPIANGTGPELARIHAVWGLGEIGRTDPRAGDLVGPCLRDPITEVRVQAIKVVGDLRLQDHRSDVIQLTTSKEPRVRFFAAQALAKMGAKDAVPALLTLLKEGNGEGDAFIRHAAAMALAACADEKTLAAAAGDNSDAVRTGVLLALRRQRNAEVARFLADKKPQLVLEAARAIHDAPIPAAWPQLAALADQAGLSEPLWRRAVNANYLLGTTEAAQRLATLAADLKAADEVRLDALQALGIWNEPFGKDRITGLWRDMPKTRDAGAARTACMRVEHVVFETSSEAVRAAMCDTIAALAVKNAEIGSTEVDLSLQLGNEHASGQTRAAALKALVAIKSNSLAKHIDFALAAQDKTLLETARQVAAKASPQAAVKVNAAVLGKGSVREQQAALATIAEQPGAEADGVIAAQLDLLLAGKVSNAIALDLIEAAGKRADGAVKAKLMNYEGLRKSDDPLAKWRECLEGGDAKIGKEVFSENAAAACMRCHKVKGEGGDVGPDLAGVATRHDRAYILQSIVDPNAVIAPGYENVMVTLKDGNIVAGLLNAEDATTLTLKSLTDGKPQRVVKADVKERTGVPSAMLPGLGEILGKRDLRNVVEFLAELK